MVTALTGKDVIKINGRILNDFGDGDTALLEYPNDLTVVKTGKNGNSIYAFNYPGRQADVTLRLLRGSDDDKFLNNLLAVYKNDPSAFSLLSGEFTKNVGDGAGGMTADTTIMSGGAFKSSPAVKENVDGETDQALAIYKLVFSNAPRQIGG
jgi:hypothetical protein